jgi:tRNA dimethylallyltransferase
MAFVKGLGAGVGRDAGLRARLEAEANEAGPAALHARLARADPARAAALHANDVRRVVRALEIVERTGMAASERRREWDSPDRVPTAIVGLARSEGDLAARIRARARRMLEGGALEEAAALRTAGSAPSKEVLQALGVRDLWACLDGRLTRDEAAERLARATLRFAKRQRTFLRKFAVTWVEADEAEPAASVADRVVAALAAAGVQAGTVRGTSS